MRISDWSSDVCSSDLVPIEFLALEAGFVVQARLVDIDPIAEQEARDLGEPRVRREAGHRVALAVDLEDRADLAALRLGDDRCRVDRGGIGEQTARRRLQMPIGRASGRDRECKYVCISGVAGSLKKKK